jgi:hypothetical protein
MAEDPTENASSPTPPESADEFDGLVLDENFVRGGTYEPPARTRVAIAKFGDQQTSWRHGGGLRRGSAQPSAQPNSSRAHRPGPRRSGERRPRPGGPSRVNHPVLPSPLLARLPIIITAIVVAVAAFLVFR